MQKRTEGIVLRSRPFGEADLIAEYLTRDFGIQSAFVKSPRKIKSRFGGSLEPFTHARITLLGKEDARLPRLTQSDIIRPFQELREDLNCFLAALELAELTLRLLPEHAPEGEAFALMLWMLDSFLNKEISGWPFIGLVFKIRLLAIAGYAPSLKACVKCGSPTTRYFPLDGALICEACKKGAGFMEVSPPLLKLYHGLSTWPLGKVMRIKPTDKLLIELRNFIEAHIKDGISVFTRTSKFREE
jgi:DNA repair protein RecO (recombination protein O)